MPSGSFRFGSFLLDLDNRRLCEGTRAVDLNSRYLDALALLVAEAGALVSKDRFMDEVWRGVPVTDEALTQCIRTLRRQLGDEAGRPRFIETVPKHGYRFIAEVALVDGAVPAGGDAGPPAETAAPPWRRTLLLGAAGTLGGALAGLAGGLIYGLAGAAQPGAGAVSVLLVLVWLTLAVATVGGAGVSFGIALAERLAGARAPALILGGAAGGLIVGGAVKLLGLDAFNLLLGRAPAAMTGAGEGLALGAAVGAAAWVADRTGWSLRRTLAASALLGAAAGLVIALAGGRLMAGSLEGLARLFPGAQLRLDGLGRLTGESGFGPATQLLTCAAEAALFTAGLTGARLRARRRLAGGGGALAK